MWVIYTETLVAYPKIDGGVNWYCGDKESFSRGNSWDTGKGLNKKSEYLTKTQDTLYTLVKFALIK